MKFSTRLLRKGSLIHETRAILRLWDENRTISENVKSALAGNAVAVSSAGWLRELGVTLASRFSEMSRPELTALLALARTDAAPDVWQACLHWHCVRTEKLYFRFATDWLFTEYRHGTFRLRSEDVVPFVTAEVAAEKGRGAKLSDYGTKRAARDLLRMAADFGILTGGPAKEFVSYHLPEESFIYVLHAMTEAEANARRLIESPDWHIYFMGPSDVERELLRLHQFRKLHYETAGSLVQLKLPCTSSAEYARELQA